MGFYIPSIGLAELFGPYRYIITSPEFVVELRFLYTFFIFFIVLGIFILLSLKRAPLRITRLETYTRRISEIAIRNTVLNKLRKF